MGAGASTKLEDVKNASDEDLTKFTNDMSADDKARLMALLATKVETLKAEKKATGVSVAIVYYSMYGHMLEMCKEMKKGMEEHGVQVDMFQVPETLPDTALKAMGAPAKPGDVMTLDHATVGTVLPEYDGFVFGIPTRYGNMCGQIKSFFDSTGGLWQSQKLAGKMATMIVSTGTQNGGQETTHFQTVSSLVHHGMCFVPLGYRAGADQFAMELHGGSPWGSSTFAGPDGSRMPSDMEKRIVKVHGEAFATVTKRSKQETPKKTPKMAIVYYSTYGHIKKLADEIAGAAKKAGVEVDMYRVAETLPEGVLTAMKAPPKAEDPVIEFSNIEKLVDYDGIMFGLPTRFGQPAAQIKSFWDSTGGLWQGGKLTGKLAASFVSTGTPQGGQETTHMTHLTNLVHHGMIYVPLGYAAPKEMFNVEELHGGSPWGASCYAGPDGSRQPSELELAIAAKQGEVFASKVKAMAME